MHLICRTTADSYFYGFTWLELTPEVARRLLSYRTFFEQVRGHDGRLYCLEFFDNTVAYGKGFTSAAIEDVGSGCWQEVPGDPGLLAGWPTCAETLKVTDSGVLWSASPKHSDGSFETEEIAWDDLDAAARGEHPFAPHKEASEAEA